MHKCWLLIGCLLLAHLGATPAQAEEGMTLSEAAVSEDYMTKFGGQMFRGATNVGMSFLEPMYIQPKLEVDAGGSVFKGIWKGLGHMFLRIGNGLKELAVSPMPRIEGRDYPRIQTDSIFDALRHTAEHPTSDEALEVW